jgi:hypothetical protein
MVHNADKRGCAGLLSTFFQIKTLVPLGLTPNPAAYINVYFGPPGTLAGSTIYQATVSIK